MSTTHEAPLTLTESAQLAWANRAERDSQRVRHSFTTQLWAKLRIPRDSLAVNPTEFGNEIDPVMSIGAVVDGITFCLDKNNALSVVNWSCADKKCTEIHRAMVKDYESLGRALALGDRAAVEQPKCQRHQ